MQGRSTISQFVHLLDSNNMKVQLRSMGALHNISSNPKSIISIRQTGKIPKLAMMLYSPNISVRGSTAGALQNLSREVASRTLIKNLNIIDPLSNLLTVEDLQARVCAAGKIHGTLLFHADSFVCIFAALEILYYEVYQSPRSLRHHNGLHFCSEHDQSDWLFLQVPS